MSFRNRDGQGISMTVEDRDDLMKSGSLISEAVVDAWMAKLCSQYRLHLPSRVAAGSCSTGFDRLPSSVIGEGCLIVQPLCDQAGHYFAGLAVRDGHIYSAVSLGALKACLRASEATVAERN
ncbi:hypothetical protein FOZ63_005733 [Perkinsus olseni]|uniref:Uncharacterized protein n=1 Tax=Perkinsus olseni TaxID=32597 RepID=A0A7J6NP11_PEROL|nr:hypothetical protein FOZ63_005733 [Perkinsus olseni]